MKRAVQIGLHVAVLSVFCISPVPGAAAEIGAPELVSPVRADGDASVLSRCPSFSWTDSENARGYQLVVYEVTDPRARERRPAQEPVLKMSLPARASSWTPTLEDCLPRAGRYGWAVGALHDDGRVDWSPPGLFRVVEAGVDRLLENEGVAPRAAAARARPSAKLTGAPAATAPSNGSPRSLNAATAFDPPPCERSLFTDVPDTDPFCKWIHQLAADKIADGCAKGDTFCPDQPVTRRQIALLLGRAMHGTETWQPCTLATAPDGFHYLRCAGGTAVLRFPARAESVGAGEGHSCSLVTGGSADCWGSSLYGQATDQAGPFIQVSAGYSHSCGVKTDGSVDCWGYSLYGQATDQAGPFTQVSAGSSHTCAVTTDGSADCWGRNDDGEATDRAGAFVQVSANGRHTCGLESDGSVDCWGFNDEGQANGPAGPFTQVASGRNHTCGVRTDQSIDCWGSNSEGQAVDPEGLFTQVSAGWFYTCGVRTNGSVDCWGSNGDGQATDQVGPFTHVSAGVYHTCGLKSDTSVACWGRDDRGQASPPLELR